jgi:hypothetical protein
MFPLKKPCAAWRTPTPSSLFRREVITSNFYSKHVICIQASKQAGWLTGWQAGRQAGREGERKRI